NRHAHAVRPATLDAHAIDPRDRFQRDPHRIEVDGQKTGTAKRRDNLLDLYRRDTLELPHDVDAADRLVEGQHEAPQHDRRARDEPRDAERGTKSALDQRLQPREPLATLLLARL